jgi:hypothetical protein
MAATATGDVRIPESARREKTAATCEVCKRTFTARELTRHHAHHVLDGVRVATTWECVGHTGRTREKVALEHTDTPRAPAFRPELGDARNVNANVAKVAPALCPAPTPLSAREDNQSTITRLERIAGKVGGDALKLLTYLS